MLMWQLVKNCLNNEQVVFEHIVQVDNPNNGD